jgi:hypothetical protein
MHTFASTYAVIQTETAAATQTGGFLCCILSDRTIHNGGCVVVQFIETIHIYLLPKYVHDALFPQQTVWENSSDIKLLLCHRT